MRSKDDAVMMLCCVVILGADVSFAVTNAVNEVTHFCTKFELHPNTNLSRKDSSV